MTVPGNNKQEQMLNVAGWVIERVCDINLYGSGNQKEPNTFFGEKAHVRTAIAYGMLNNPWLIQNNLSGRPRKMASMLHITRSGNCDFLGATAYSLCRDVLSNDFFVAMVSDTDEKHTFALIGQKEHVPIATQSGRVVDPNKQYWIAVDPWPIFPRAVLFSGHLSYGHTISWWYPPKLGKGTMTFGNFDAKSKSSHQQLQNFYTTNESALFNIHKSDRFTVENWRYPDRR